MIEQFDAHGRPALIKVLCHDYAVLWESMVWSNKYDKRGECDGITQTITLLESLPPHQQAVTFLHEVMHALAFTVCATDEMDFEGVARMYAPLIVTFWRDNPKTFDWWAVLLGIRGECMACEGEA